MRTCRFDVKGENQVETPQDKSTNAKHRGGPACSSDEASVMEVEQRRWLVQFEANDQPDMGGVT